MSTQRAAEALSARGVYTKTLAILIASREGGVRARLRQLLEGEDDMSVIAESTDLDCTRAHVHECRPDVVALALNLRGLPELSALRTLLGEAHDTRYVVMDVQHNADWETLPDAIRLATSTQPAGGHSC
jgi:DNA-binding NarL/FixJ family response regulator